MELRKNATRLHTFNKNASPTPPEFNFSRPALVKLNRLQTDLGLFSSETHKRGMSSTAVCECGAKEQTADHVVASCSVYHHPNRARVLSDVDRSQMNWLKETCSAFQWTIQLLSISTKQRRRMNIEINKYLFLL